MTRVNDQVPISEKFLLTISEAAQYFNIGEKKLNNLANEYLRLADMENNLFIENGNRKLIKRRAFEKFLSTATVI